MHAVGMIKFSITKGLEHFPELWQQTNEKKKNAASCFSSGEASVPPTCGIGVCVKQEARLSEQA